MSRQRGQIKEAVLGTLKESPNLHVTATEIMEKTQLERQQVNSTLATLAKDLAPYVRRVTSGVYLYSPNSPGRIDGMYEAIGQTHDNEMVIRDEEGNLYVARPL